MSKFGDNLFGYPFQVADIQIWNSEHERTNPCVGEFSQMRRNLFWRSHGGHASNIGPVAIVAAQEIAYGIVCRIRIVAH